MIDGYLVVHYIYAKAEFRGYGFADALLKQVLSSLPDDPHAIIYTHKTSRGSKLANRLQSQGVIPEHLPVAYDPYLLYSSLPMGWYKCPDLRSSRFGVKSRSRQSEEAASTPTSSNSPNKSQEKSSTDVSSSEAQPVVSYSRSPA